MLFNKKPTVQPEPNPQLAFTIESTRKAWWGIFTSCLGYVFDDTESILQGAGRAKEIVAAARAIADAAIDEYEDRWKGVEF